MAQSSGYDGNNIIPLLPNNDETDDNLNLEDLSKGPLPLGLKLTLTPEMLQFKEAKKVEKLKAAHFQSYMLMIGFFKIEAKYPEDLVAKFYYAKRKLVWEMLRDGLKDKIEIQWDNITAIRAVIQEGILEIEVDRVPLFFREVEPKPGKHTMWAISQDFTNGQASIYRRHYLLFPPGVLDQHYAKLLQCDNRLLELSQKSFPNSQFAYFDSELDQGTTYYSFGHDPHVHGPNSSVIEQQYNLFSPQKVQLPLIPINGPTSDEAINNKMLQDPINPWSQGLHYDTLSERGLQQNRFELNYEPLNWSHFHCIPEIEYDH
ncbi:uncharacterized protein LOC130718802 [Lotus japonicus]|uniref:uncharacterized protein LOC130718802 n=1 Tax=Lotus japonicus TaxID=34305 RepID=UPI002590964A|nr:uncharacterized protein LOC130718802 [Lotus japonicus]